VNSVRKWSCNDLVDKAKRPKVWKKLERSEAIADHWPDQDVVKAAVEKLRADGNDDAADRIESNKASQREDMLDTDYGS